MTVAAWVGDRPIPVSLVDERVAALRAGPYAGRLPHPDTAEGRNLRRWLVQVLTIEAVVEREARIRDVVPDGSPPRPVSLAQALRTGGVTAAVVAAHPLARPLREHVAPLADPPAPETAAYYQRNRDRYPQPFPEVRDAIAAELAAGERDRRFTRWLDERCAALVRLEAGYEHPGDPRQPDATHRH